MTQRMFNVVAGVIFVLVALLHALRLLVGWSVVIGGWVAPGWVSIVGLLIAGTLAYVALTLHRPAR